MNPSTSNQEKSIDWNAIFALSRGNEWVKIGPEHGLRAGLGICGRVIQMKVSADGMNDFIARLNRIGDKKQ